MMGCSSTRRIAAAGSRWAVSGRPPCRSTWSWSASAAIPTSWSSGRPKVERRHRCSIETPFPINFSILHVPYRGGAQAYNDLLGGRVDMVFGNIPEALRLSREGQVRPLAVTGAARSPQAPEVPAMAEFLPGYEINSWGGVLGPAGIQPATVERIAEVGREAVESAE